MVVPVTEAQFQAEKQYQASITIAKSLLAAGLLTEQEYALIDSGLIDKYRPSLGALFSQNHLL